MKLDELEGGKAVLQRILDAYRFAIRKTTRVTCMSCHRGQSALGFGVIFSPGMLLLHALWTLGCLYVGWQQGRGTGLMQRPY